MRREFTAIIEQDEERYFSANVPELHGCHTQAHSLDELMERVREVMALCLEVRKEDDTPYARFVGVQRVAV